MSFSWKETIDRNVPVLLLGGVAICAIVFYLFAFVIPNHPSRPSNVPRTATLVLMGWSHFWQECWFDPAQQQDKCRIYNGNGEILHDEVFQSANDGSAVPEEQLKIAPGGNSYSVHLLNGIVLIPQKNFDEIRKELQGNLSGTK